MNPTGNYGLPSTKPIAEHLYRAVCTSPDWRERLRYAETVRWHLAKCDIRVSHTYRSGKARTYPVFVCPTCRKPVRVLYSYYGPRCRTCAGVRYQSQTHQAPVSYRRWSQRMRELIYPTLKEGSLLDHIRIQAAMGLNLSPSASKWVEIDKLQAANSKVQAEPTGPEWPFLPPPLHPVRRPVGRPNMRKHRAFMLDLRRQMKAEIAALPKCPAGRPKTHRAYDTTSRRETSHRSHVGPGMAYCVGCRKPQALRDPSSFITSNGRPATRGTCTECGRGLCRMGKSPEGIAV